MSVFVIRHPSLCGSVWLTTNPQEAQDLKNIGCVISAHNENFIAL